MYPQWVCEEAQKWNDGIFSEIRWEKDRDSYVNNGEAGGYIVRSPECPFPAYLKPTKHDGRPRAAYEKIAADLAAQINVLVPPVLLYENRNASRGEEPHQCVSLILYEKIVELHHLRSMKGFELTFVRQKISESSGIIAYDTFLSNTDRNNERNIIYGISENENDEKFMYIDFSNSMNYEKRWENENFNRFIFPSFPPELLNFADVKMIENVIERIEQFSDSNISKTISRIPGSYLEDKEKAIIQEGLIERKKNLRKFLATRYPEIRR